MPARATLVSSCFTVYPVAPGFWVFTGSQLLVLEHVERGELARVHTLEAQDLDAGPREAALRQLRGALHEQDHRGRADGLLDGLLRLLREPPALEGCEERRRAARHCLSGHGPGGLAEALLPSVSDAMERTAVNSRGGSVTDERSDRDHIFFYLWCESGGFSVGFSWLLGTKLLRNSTDDARPCGVIAPKPLPRKLTPQ
jgi:hypothetical protein